MNLCTVWFNLITIIYQFSYSVSQDDFVFTSTPMAVSFISPESVMRFNPWNFAKYSKMEMQFHTREPRGILFFVGSSSSSQDCIGLELFNSNLYGFGIMLSEHFRIKLNPDKMSISTGKFHKVIIQVYSTNYLTMQLDNYDESKQIPTPGKLEFESYTYIGGIDTIYRLPWISYSQSGFSGCINYLRINNDKFVDMSQHSKLISMQGTKTGVCETTPARCLPGICGPGKCYERSYNLLDNTKNFYCDCSGTPKSYSLTARNILRGESCIIDSTKFECNSKTYLRYSFDEQKNNHFDDISLDFKTTSMKESLFLMKSGNNDDIKIFISAEIIAGQLLVIMQFVSSTERNSFQPKKFNLNDGQWHTLKISRYADNTEIYIDDIGNVVKGKLYEKQNLKQFFNQVKEVFLGSLTRPPGKDKCSGEFRNFYWNDFDLLGKQNQNGQYRSEKISEKPILPILPPFPRQPPMPCTAKPNHQYTTFNSVPLTIEYGMFMVEFKTKYDGIILHASTPDISDQFMTVLLTSNSIVLVYKFLSIQGVRINEVTRGGITLRDNTWHRIVLELNKQKESIMIFVDDVESLTTEVRLPNSRNLIKNIYSMVVNVGSIQDYNQHRIFITLLQENAMDVAKSFDNMIDYQFVGCYGDFLVNKDNFTVNYFNREILTQPTNALTCRACQDNNVKCPKSYCQNRGRCYNIRDKEIRCDCKGTGFYGKFCDIKMPSCVPNPCKNQGYCQIVNNNRFCNCTGTGYVGTECEISRCNNYKCLNNGICKIKNGLPVCDCSTTPYEGIYCENPKCPLDFCLNNGKCLLDQSTQLPYCVCKGTGYTGVRCDKTICTPQKCNNNGNCIIRDDLPACYCNDQYTGLSCDQPICSKDECLNKGICNVVNRRPLCSCMSDFQGDRCESPKPCPSGYCLYGGQCQIKNGLPECNCSKTYYRGINCEIPKACPDNYCQNGGSCLIIGNNFVCNCSNIGYTGEKCNIKIGCPSGYCKNGGICEVKDGKFKCDCSVTAYGGELCNEKSNGVLCDYRNPGYSITSFKPPIISEGIVTSMGFQTFVPTGVLFCYETKDDKYWLIKLVNGKLVVDINGIEFHMNTIVNDGKPHLVKVMRDAVQFIITIDNPVSETFSIPTSITSILTLPNNIIIYTKLTLCNSCPETSNRNRFQGAIGNAMSGGIKISNQIKAGQGAMIGGIQNEMIPMTPLPSIPQDIPCSINYCKNGGVCFVRNYGPTCKCEVLQFTGDLCDKKVFIFKSVPPTPGYIINNISPIVASNFDVAGFLFQLSESSSPLTTFVTADGNYFEIRTKNDMIYMSSNGAMTGPLNNLKLKRNVTHSLKIVNLLGRLTLYLNGTRLGHIKLTEPVLMRNGSIELSKVIVGANKNFDETLKGFIGDFFHNNFNLFGPDGVLAPSTIKKPTIKIEPLKIYGRSMPDVKKVFKGTHGGVVFHLSKFEVAEGFGAGGIIPISAGPIILGAGMLGATFNPLALGLILAFILLIIAIIWAIEYMICRIPGTGVFYKGGLVTSVDISAKTAPLFRTYQSYGMGNMQYGANGYEQANLSLVNSAKNEIDFSASSNYNRMEFNKANEMNSGSATMNTGGLAQSKIAASGYQTMLPSMNLQMDKTTSFKYGNVYAQQDLSLNQSDIQNNVFTGGELKLDCCVLSNNNKYAITGSVSGPPQMWDLNDGSLIHIMDGTNQACTSLHLALDNTILIGLINQNQNPFSLKLLMMWNFPGGQIVEFQNSLYCTTCCVSVDGKSLILSDEMKESGKGSITIINLINENQRKLFYNRKENGTTDGIKLLKLTTNNAYLVAGYRTNDNLSCYIIFDTTKQNNEEIDSFKIKSNLNCFEIINDNEAVVGTENGELIVWSLQSVKAIRQILISAISTGGLENKFNPHESVIKCMAISKDGSIFATGSIDSQIKVWSMAEEYLLCNLDKHTDAVHSLVISNDNTLVVSGSVDGSIRVWNTSSGQEICSFNSNIEISKVLISDDKNIIVGLGERLSVNKLVMLKILRNVQQVKRIGTSNDKMNSLVSPPL